jgi:hypothetical protein
VSHETAQEPICGPETGSRSSPTRDAPSARSTADAQALRAIQPELGEDIDWEIVDDLVADGWDEDSARWWATARPPLADLAQDDIGRCTYMSEDWREDRPPNRCLMVEHDPRWGHLIESSSGQRRREWPGVGPVKDIARGDDAAWTLDTHPRPTDPIPLEGWVGY